MRRYSSDSQMSHIIKCRLCKAKYMQNGELNSANCNQLVENSDGETAADELNQTTASLGPAGNVQYEAGRCNSNKFMGAKITQNVNSMRSQITKEVGRSELLNQSISNSNTKLSRILRTWPYSQLQEMTSGNGNDRKDGELINACIVEMERRQRAYENWKKEWQKKCEMESYL